MTSSPSPNIRVHRGREPGTWTRYARDTVLVSPWISVSRNGYKNAHGDMVDDYYLVERADVAIVCAITDDQDLLLVQQFRYGVGRLDWELPGGGIEDGEQPSAAAGRELTEETGFVAESLDEVGVLDRDAGSSPSRIFVFLARRAVAGRMRPGGADGELRVGLVDWRDSVGLVAAGSIREQSSVAALLLCHSAAG